MPSWSEHAQGLSQTRPVIKRLQRISSRVEQDTGRSSDDQSKKYGIPEDASGIPIFLFRHAV